MATTFTQIASVSVGSGGAASIDFTSIPSTYTDLCLVWSGRTARVSAQDGMKLQFNASTTNYSDRGITGDGVSASSFNSATTYIYGGIIPSATATANTFGSISYYVPNYASSNNKSVSVDSVSENNTTTAFAILEAGLWSDSSAITSIKISSENAADFVQYSTATLYGVSKS
jgi:hypothetical protein